MSNTQRQPEFKNYTIRDIIDYRSLSWSESDDFLYLTEIPMEFEPYFVNPDYYCFGMITSGSLQININNQLHNLSLNSLMVYRPGQRFKVKRVAEATKGVFILFTRKFLDHLQENIFSVKRSSFLSDGVQTRIDLKAADQQKILTTFDGIFALLHHLSRPNWELVARNLTSALLYEADHILQRYLSPVDNATDRDKELYLSFKHLLATNCHNQRGLDFYADQLCVSKDYLYAVVKRTSGMSPTKLLQSMILDEAKYLIRNSVKSLGEIGYQLGFGDPFTFSKYFKKVSGYSPSKYRKLIS